MKQIQTTQDIQQLGTILTVWAHPDDETYLAGGIMAAAIKNGQEVICVTATHGEAGSQGRKLWPAKELGKVRTKELSKALKTIGITKHHWLDYNDGGCCHVPEAEACHCLEQFIAEYKPDTILTFGSDGLTGHEDHATVSHWVDRTVAALAADKPAVYQVIVTQDQYRDYLKDIDKTINLFFNIDKPRVVDAADCGIAFKLPDDIAHIKRKALAQMPSQTKILLKNFDPKFIDQAFGLETFVLAK